MPTAMKLHFANCDDSMRIIYGTFALTAERQCSATECVIRRVEERHGIMSSRNIGRHFDARISDEFYTADFNLPIIVTSYRYLYN